MMYFTIQEEYSAFDLTEKLLGYGGDESDKIIELAQAYDLEEVLLDLVDTNIGQNVEPYEITDDIKENTSEYIQYLRENVREDKREDFEESIIELGL